MKRFVMACATLVLAGSAAWAGVVVEMEITSSEDPGREGIETFTAQGEMTRTDMSSAGKGASSVIFRDQAMYFMDHGKKVCQKIDKQTVEQLSQQLAEVMKQMENLPPEQRAMMEKMMKGKMPGTSKQPVLRVDTGGADKVGDYPCTVYTMFSDDQMIQDVCVADESVGDDIMEAMGAFKALAEFAAGLMKVAENLPFAGMIEIPYKEIHEMNGFPVRTRHYNDEGQVTLVRKLNSVTRQEIPAATFAIPKDYKMKDLAKELQNGR